MAVTVEYVGPEYGGANGAAREVAVVDAAVVYNNEFVTLSSGRVTSASIAKKRLLGAVDGVGSKLLGRSQRVGGMPTSVTGNSAGTVKVLVNVEPGARYLCKMASGTAAATDEGKYFNLAGSPGSQVVTNTAVADLGQLILVKANPGIRGTDNTYGLFQIADNYRVSVAALV